MYPAVALKDDAVCDRGNDSRTKKSDLMMRIDDIGFDAWLH